MKLNAEELLSNLGQFIGTERYFRILPTFVVTDGVKYLMDQADCYWLPQLYGLHLASVDFNDNPLTILKLRRMGRGAKIAIEDGNSAVLEWQTLDYTDFPFDEFTLYACWGGEYWVCMLPSEY